MHGPVPERNASYSTEFAAAWLGGPVALFGAGMALAWAFAPGLKDALSPIIKANTALALGLIGGSLCIARGRPLGRALAALAALIGALTIAEYALHANFGIDQLITADAYNAESAAHPGRMAPNAALSLLLTGAGIALLPGAKRGVRLACSGALGIVLLFSALADVGYLYGAPSLYRFGGAIRISVYTASALVLACAGALSAWPQGTFAALFLRRTAGGVIARRLLFPVIAVPVALGWVRNELERQGIFDDRVGTAALAVAVIAVLGAIAWTLARQIDHADAAQKEALRLRDEFIGLAAHELRTPLTSLRLLLQLEERRRAPAGRAVVMRQVERLARLVETMLDTTRLSVGTLSIERHPVDFARLVREAIERVADEPQRAQVTLDAPPELPVQGDPLRLAQLVDNLVSNALRYGEGHPVEVRVGRANGSVRLVVRDHGIGFTPEDRERIFAPFARAAPSTSYGGLGLGLYLAREIVLAHGGTIEANGTPGAGAEFVVSLPER